jgi:uncharacterized protein YfaS (alpha-2-macroglobulin family)
MHPVSNPKHKRALTIFVSLLVIFTLACSCSPLGIFGRGTPAPTPTIDVANLPPTTPQVIAQRPFPGEEMRLDGSVDVYFDQPMDQASVVAALQFDPAISVTTSWIDGETLRLTPDQPLERASIYTITVGQSAKSADGLTMEAPVEIEVQTVGYLEVSQAVPAPDTSGVETNSVITVMFNRPVVPLGIVEEAETLPDPLRLEPSVPGQGEWLNTSIYQFKPSEPLAGGITYTATVGAGLEDQLGAALDEDYTWQFTTLLPSIVEVRPTDGEDMVGLDQAVEMVFNQPMDLGAAQAAFSMTDAGGGRVLGAFEWDDETYTLTFTPAEWLALDETYTVRVDAAASAVSGGVGLDRTYTWSFQTVPAPAIIRTEPANGTQSASPYEGISLFFASPMNEATLKGKLIVEPALPEEANIFYDTYSNAYRINTTLEPSTRYTVTFNPGAADPYGHRIAQPYTFSFITGPSSPMLQLNAPYELGLYNAEFDTQLFVLYRNVSRIDFTLSELEMGEFARLTGPRSYEEFEKYQPPEARIIREWSMASEGELNEATYAKIPLAREEGGALAPGVYLLSVSAPEVESSPIRHLMVVANANLTFKLAQDEALLWLTDLNSGQPVGDVPVLVYGTDFGQVASGRTDQDGLLRVDMPRQDGLWDPRYAVAQSGDVFAVALSSWSEGIDSWQFGLPSDFYPSNFSLYLHTDRPLYRPGQDVNFRGILRAKDDVTYSLPDTSAVPVEITNDQGDAVYSQRLPLDEFGAFSGTLMLDQEASLGYYSINVELGPDFSQSLGFQVAEYRKPEFIVNVTPEADEVVAGDTIKVLVEADFFFGGPVSDADVTWTVLSDAYYFDYSGPGRYDFTDVNIDTGEEQFVPGYGQVIEEGEGRTDAEGKFVIEVPADLGDAVTSRRFTIEAVVTDINEQSVAGRTEVIVHQGLVYVGLIPELYVGTAGEQQTINLLVVDWESEPVARQEVEVTVVERRWNNVREEDEFGRQVWTWSVEEIPVGEPETVRTNAEGQATFHFTPPKGGVYKIRAVTRDEAGNQVSASTFMWVSGGEFISWRQANNSRIDLVADKDKYEPGDTAEILIASPFQGQAKALVTIERGRLLTQEVITLTSNSYVYKLPITGDLAPNVYVSVVIVKGVDDTNPVPAFRMGLVNLEIDTVEQEINVEVTPDKEQAGPRDEVTYTIKTTDHRGRPVSAEVALSLADLAALSLSAPNSGPIVDHFYGIQPLGVRTAVPLTYSVDRLNQELFDKGKGGGGGGAEGFFEIRGDFRDTAYWKADLITDKRGTASVTVQLPDNLTTWRMDARAVTADTLVGQTTVDIVATKPLLIRPVTPRFFVVGDEATLTAVVNNNTDKRIEATIALTANAGVTLQGDPEHQVGIPAGGRVEVGWPVKVGDEQYADLVFSVEGGGLQDASKPTLGIPPDQTLPIYRYEVPETVGTAGQLIEAGSRLEGVALPRIYDVTQGQLRIQLDPSLAASTVDGLTYLEHFPYECTEQTVSRFLPNVLTVRAFRELGLQDPELEANLERVVNTGLQRLYSQQHVDGGWGWFVQGESNPVVSAYVVLGMVEARDAGFEVSEESLGNGIAFLAAQPQPLNTLDEHWKLNRQAFLLYVLARAGVPDVSYTVQLYENRQALDHYARAWLAQTLYMLDSEDKRVNVIMADLMNSAILSATGAHWEEAESDWWNWNTDTRSTAIILDTYARIDPNNNIVPNVVRWLMVAREGGHWETTQETAWALIGLTDWMSATGELNASYDFGVELNGRQVATGKANAETLRESTVLTFQMSELLMEEVNRVQITRGAGPGRLYYTAHLTAYLPVEEVEPLSRGIVVSRRYFRQGDPSTPVTTAQVGDLLTVRLTIIAPHDLYYVVVEDPLPAGMEAVDVSLQTESVVEGRPTLNPADPLAYGWGWWLFSDTDLRDEKAVLFADVLPAGTYEYTYTIRAGLAGKFRVIPPTAREFYFPEVYGRGAGSLFAISE